LSLSTHFGTPVEQEVVPFLQALVVVQAAPAVHGEHVPMLQTLSVPHGAPSLTFIPVSTQLTDGEQTVVPA